MIWQDHDFEYGQPIFGDGGEIFLKFRHLQSRIWWPYSKSWSRHIMFYVLYPVCWKNIPRVIGFWKMYLVFSKTWKIYLAFSKIWKHIFQSRRQKLRREGYIGRKDTCFLSKRKKKLDGRWDPLPLMENALDFFHFFYPFPIMGWMFWCKKVVWIWVALLLFLRCTLNVWDCFFLCCTRSCLE